MVLVDYALGVPSPKLQVPNKFKVSLVEELEIKIKWKNRQKKTKNICCTHRLQPTRDDRGWIINPVGPNPWWTTIITFIPSLLCTILIFMDQQITAVIINRKEHKLKV